jgi:hypothetical protein
MTSTIFVARFADGEVTRMSIYTPKGKLDSGRGLRLSRHAHNQRTGKQNGLIVAAHFEQGGIVVRSCTTKELAAARRVP